MPKKTFFNLPDDKRQKIIDVAIEEFSTKGFGKTSINSIVARAGIAKGSIYQYFDDKKDFYLYLVTCVRESYMTRRTSVVGDISKQPLRATLKKTILFFQNYKAENPTFVQFFFAMSSDTSIPFVQEIAKIVTDPSLGYVKEIIDCAIKRGEIKSGLDRNLLMFEFASLITAFQRASVIPGYGSRFGIEPENRNSLDAKADALIDLLLDGVGK